MRRAARGWRAGLLAGLLVWGILALTATHPAESATPEPSASQAAPGPAAPAPPAPSGAPPSQALSAIAVCGVNSGPGRAALYDNEPIKVEVKGLRDWLTKHKDDASPLVLFLDGRAVPKLPVRVVGPRKDDLDKTCWGKATSVAGASAETEVLIFDLERNKDSNPVWRVLLARPDEWNFRRTFKVGVGLGGNVLPDTTGGATVTLAVIDTAWALGFGGIVAASLVLLVAAGYWTNMLRDTTGPPLPDGRRPFSLGRVQMAFWFFIVVAAYVLIYLVTGDLHNLTTSALWLIGISSATALGSIAVDVVNQKPRGAGAGGAVAPGSGAAGGAGAAGVAGGGVVVNAGAALVNTMPFFQDLLGTDDGDSLHRLQMMVWTAVLGTIFVYSVLQNLVMPEFSTEALSLMGVSGGTYIGFKLKETPKS